MKMALFHGFIAALAFAFMVSFVQGKPQIVEPFPLNLFPFEEENGQVSCVVTDTTGAKPDRIEFLKVSQFGDKTKIPDQGSSGHTYYSNSTEDSGKKLITTLHFNKVKKGDEGTYECVGHSSGKQDPYGFTINVITKSELPTAKMQSASVLLGKPAKLFCNITVAFTTTIKNILWIKNSEIINHVLYPVRPDSYSEALTFPRTSLQDGGDYTCVGLVSFRRGNRKMNMTFGIATLEVKVEVVVEVDRNTTDVYAVANGNATLECPISGESVDITWWRVDDDGTEIKLNMSQRFASTKACPKCHSILTIAGLGSDDQGKYACKVSGSSAKHFFDLFVNPETPTTETTKKPDIKSGSISTLYCIQSTIMLLAGLVAWLTR